MNKALNTPLYNPIYYDFLKNNKQINQYLPDFRNINWDVHTKSVMSQSEVYSTVKKILIEDNSDISSEKGVRNLELLTNDKTTFIVTGQQLGLLASPLYTIYKIITSLKLADYLNSLKNGNNYVPIFWLESEDHDFEEINHFGIWDKKFEPKTLNYEGKVKGKTSIKHYNFEPQIEDIIKLLQEELILTEFSEDLYTSLHHNFKSGASWLLANLKLLKNIFHESGLLFFNPSNVELKKISVPFFNKILENSNELNDKFRNTSEKLVDDGYFNQVTFIDGKTFLFIENEHLQREHIYFQNDNYFLKDSQRELSKKDMFDIIRNNPEKISTSVVSRPLLQSWLLPTTVYVAGPGEIAYWTQIGAMFEKMKLKMPVVYPRISATILEPKILRFINKYDILIEDLPKKHNEFVNRVLSIREDKTFSESKNIIATEIEKIKQKMISVDQTLESTSQKTGEKILGQIDFLEHKTIKATEQKEQSMVSHLKQIHAAFFPNGYPQERYLTFVYYINKFGPGIINTLFDKIELDQFDHQIIDI